MIEGCVQINGYVWERGLCCVSLVVSAANARQALLWSKFTFPFLIVWLGNQDQHSLRDQFDYGRQIAAAQL